MSEYIAPKILVKSLKDEGLDGSVFGEQSTDFVLLYYDYVSGARRGNLVQDLSLR